MSKTPNDTLQKKLHTIVENAHRAASERGRNDNITVMEILQAFQESIMPILNKQTKCIQDIIDTNNLMANTVLLPNVMTGQEFYDRFKAELEKTNVTVTHDQITNRLDITDIQNKVLEAARQAAGVSE